MDRPTASRERVRRWRAPDRRRRFLSADGLSLVEMIVALLILAVVLSASAASLIGFSRQSVVNERRVQATAFLNQQHERLQALPFELAVHYDTELGEFPADIIPALDPDDDTTWSFDGEPLVVTEECPDGIEELCDRDLRVPEPVRSTVDVDGRSFEDAITIVTWATDGAPPEVLADEPTAKRFTTIVTWRVLGRPFSQSFESLRAPTAAEIDPPIQPIVQQFVSTPSSLRLTQEGGLVLDDASGIGVEAIFRREVSDVRVTFPCYIPDPIDPLDPTEGYDEDGYRTGTADECEVDLTDVGTDGRSFRGSVVLPADYIWVLGSDQLRLNATEDATLEPIPPRFADVTFTEDDGNVRPSITSVLVTPGTARARNNRELCEDVLVTAMISDVSDDAAVTASFEGDATVGRDLTLVGGTWQLQIDSGANGPWSPPANTPLEVTFVVTARNPDDGPGDPYANGLSSRPQSSNTLTVSRSGNCNP